MTVDLRFREVHGYRRALRIAGEGPPLLLIHGLADSSETWLPIFDELAEHHTVIAPDLLGHGESDKPRADYAVAAYACGMRDLLTVLGIDRVSVVGHSLGGGVAMQFAYQFPERCERIVLVSSAGMGPEVHPAVRLATVPGAAGTLKLISAAPVRHAVLAAEPVLRLLGGVGLGPDLAYMMTRYARFADPEARRAFLRTVRGAADISGQAITMLDRSYLAAELPTLVIWGDRDPIIPAAHAEVARTALPGSRLEVFEGAGHFPHHHDPARFAKVVGEFLRGTAPARYDRGHWQDVLREGRPDAPAASSGT
ncbi:pimeloyl-ACP methyl ester carboxylesterase [Actinocorallia herbida]|uniref:Pimeloyl-ACP methyl ester carboxylesterase n=1 Tax=Actinocorallia herbida TaxID=58109 RepID=A0A3N1DBH3_9ACTN|nr:alpha/beta fold hydrolase [Actinocorallia herbida]ROO90873.1 pimeloyl-ACP methyl ester carboxylesterase [Actinocorallia herbida]